MERTSKRIREVIHATPMKRSHEVPPLRVAAHLRPDAAGLTELEWSRVHDFDETVDIGLPDNRATELAFKLKRWVDHRIGAYEDEIRMLRRLHRTDHMEIFIDEGTSPEQVGLMLEDYWRTRQTRHSRRMLVAGIAVLPALVLTVLPGPNVVGIPLAYLAWHHWRIVKGLKRMRSGKIEVEVKRQGHRHVDASLEPVTSTSIGNEAHQVTDI